MNEGQKNDKNYSVELRDNYVHLMTWGTLELESLDQPVNAAINLAKEKKVDLILDDIREIDSDHVSVHIQAKAAGILWKLKTFRKVAIIFKTQEIGWLFFSTLEALHLNNTFKGFDNEAEAIAWLQEA